MLSSLQPVNTILYGQLLLELLLTFDLRYFTVPVTLVLPAVAVCGWCKLTPDLDPTSFEVTWFLLVIKYAEWVKFHIFRLSYQLTSHQLWPSFVTFNLIHMWRFLHNINKPSLVPITLQLFKWGEFYILSPSYNVTSNDIWPCYMTFDCMNIQKVPYFINTHIVSINQDWFQSDFDFSNETLSDFQPILQLDLRWPLTLICVLWPHQQIRVPMLHLWPNFGWNLSKLVADRAKC